MNLHLAVCFLCAAAFSRAFAQSRRPSNCCLRVSRITVRLDNILDYRWQDKGLCPVTAVVFETRSRNKLCSDPNRDWTKRAMSKVDKDKEREEAAKSKKDSAALTSDSPAEANGEGASPPTPTTLPMNSRWLRESAVSAAPKKQHEAEGLVKSTEVARGSKKQGKGGKKKRKGKNRVRKVKNTSQ